MVRLVRAITTAFNALAALAIVFMMLNVAGTVIMRIVHAVTGGAVNLIWQGSIEMAVLSLTVVVFAALHGAFLVGAIKVDIFTEWLPPAVQRVVDGLYGLLYAAFAGVMTWRFYQATATTFERGDATQDLLMPLFYIYAFLTVACAALTVVATLWSVATTVGIVRVATVSTEGV